MSLYATWNNQTSFAVGDTVRVHQKLVEDTGKEKKARIQIFEGMVIAFKNQGDNKSFTVRKIGANLIGVERIWPLKSPWIVKIEKKTAGKVRRAKLYYTRDQSRKELRKITQSN